MSGKKGNRISSFSVILIIAAISLLGLAAIPVLDLQYKPSRPVHTLTVHYSYPGATPQDAEMEVTSKIEGIMSSLEGATATSSVSSAGSGSVSVNIDKRVKLEKARLELSSAIRSLWPRLPHGVSYPEITSDTRGRQPVESLVYNIQSQLPTKDLLQLANTTIIPVISSIEGVENISVNGVTPYIYEFVYDAGKCRKLGISHSDISQAIRNNEWDAFDYGDIPVKKVGGRIVRLEDIVSLSYKEGEPSSYYRINGRNTINLAIRISSEKNLLRIVNNIRKGFDSVADKVPESVTTGIAYDTSEFVRAELSKVFLRLVLCTAILLLFILIAYKSFKFLLIIICALVSNILASFILYVLLGIEIHIFTLAGITISIGIIIDSSIVMIDHYSRYKDRKVIFPLSAAILTNIAALLLVFLLPEEEKVYLVDFVWAVVINLGISVPLSYFFIPAMLDYCSVAVEVRRKDIPRWYGKYIGRGKKFRWAVVVASFVLIGLCYYPFHQSLDRHDFYKTPSRKVLCIQAGMPHGCTVAQMNEVICGMEDYLSGFDQIQTFVTDIPSADNARITVYFRPEYENTSFPATLQFLVSATAKSFGGASWKVYGITPDSFSNFIGAPGKNKRFLLKGYDYQALLSYAHILVDFIKGNERVFEPEIWSNAWSGAPATRHEWSYDFDNISLSGKLPSEIHSDMLANLYNYPVKSVFHDGERTSVYLKSSENDEYDLWHVSNALGQYGSIEQRESEISIFKYNQTYILSVCYDYIGSPALANRYAKQVISFMESDVLPLGYLIEAPEIGRFHDNQKQYGWIIALIALVIFAMLVISTESLRIPIAIIYLIPSSFAGVFLLFGLTSLSFDQGAFAGMVMLCGLTVNAGIYLVYEYRRTGKYLVALSNKIRPICLTLFSTIIGLLPFLSKGPTEVFWFDFAITTIIGLVFSLIAIVFIFPLFVVRPSDALAESSDS